MNAAHYEKDLLKKPHYLLTEQAFSEQLNLFPTEEGTEGLKRAKQSICEASSDVADHGQISQNEQLLVVYVVSWLNEHSFVMSTTVLCIC